MMIEDAQCNTRSWKQLVLVSWKNAKRMINANMSLIVNLHRLRITEVAMRMHDCHARGPVSRTNGARLAEVGSAAAQGQ